MLYLEIRHPRRERMVLPLRDGVFFLPPSGLEEASLRWRLRMVVSGDRVRLERLGEEGILRTVDARSRPIALRPVPRVERAAEGAAESEVVEESRAAVELRPGDSVEVDQTRLTLRMGSRELARRSSSPRVGDDRDGVGTPRPVSSGPSAVSGAGGSPPSAPPPNSASLPNSLGSSLGNSIPPPVPMPVPMPTTRAGARPQRILAGPERDHRLRVAGRDRWILMSLFASGRLGRRDLGRAALIYRNQFIAGRPRSVPEILSKERFLGREFEATLQEVEAGFCLACTSCHRAFEPEGSALLRFRCPECDRRLACAPRSVNEIAVGARSPSRLSTRYDRLMPGVRLGDYKVQQLLGVGGYGAVYKAFDTRIQRTVALKVFPAGADGEPDVLREARNIASLPSHAHLVLVFHVGRALGLDYISYEYVSGHSLAYHIERRTSMTLEEKLRLLRDVLMGLQVAHEHGVIHRDLKPDNILLVRREGKFRAKVTDFGLGMRLRRGQGAYHSRTLRGAPEYLAPEQFRTQVSSGASDLYSVGATFFHLLTGRPPFEGTTDQEFAERHQIDPVPFVSESTNGPIPASLDRMFQRLLAKDPRGRPSDAMVALDLLAEVEDELEPDRGRRYRRVIVTLSVLVALLAVGTVLQMGQGERLVAWLRGEQRAGARERSEASVASNGDTGADHERAGAEAGLDPRPSTLTQGGSAEPSARPTEAENSSSTPPDAKTAASEDAGADEGSHASSTDRTGEGAEDPSSEQDPAAKLRPPDTVVVADAGAGADPQSAGDGVRTEGAEVAVATEREVRADPEALAVGRPRRAGDSVTGNSTNPEDVDSPPAVHGSRALEAARRAAESAANAPGDPLVAAADRVRSFLLSGESRAFEKRLKGLELSLARQELDLLWLLDVLLRDAVPIVAQVPGAHALDPQAATPDFYLQTVASSQLLSLVPDDGPVVGRRRVYSPEDIVPWLEDVQRALRAKGLQGCLSVRLPYKEDLLRPEVLVLETHRDDLEWFQDPAAQYRLYDRLTQSVRDVDLRPSCFRLRLKVVDPELLVQRIEVALQTLGGS